MVSRMYFKLKSLLSVVRYTYTFREVGDVVSSYKIFVGPTPCHEVEGGI